MHNLINGTENKKKTNVGILFPHQLFEQNFLIGKCDIIYFVEELLFFKQYMFHKQKIAFHRASMMFYENHLKSKNIKVVYIDSFSELADVRKLIPYMKSIGITAFEYIDTTDCWLEQRIDKACKAHNIHANKNQFSLFINSTEDIKTFFRIKSACFKPISINTRG